MSALTLQFLNAREGDAVWVRWAGRQLIVDMGKGQTGKRIAQRLRDLPEDQRHFELLVVTHVDGDHIGGVLSALVDAEPIPRLSFGDVWFNGWQHLQKAVADEGLEPLGPAQGEELSAWLQHQPWNITFGGAAVTRSDLAPINLGDGLQIRVLGPTSERLTALAPIWKTEVDNAIANGRLTVTPVGLESLGGSEPPTIVDAFDLQLLAEKTTRVDAKPANGSSIQLLLEYDDRRILLTGDAFAADVHHALRALQPAQPGHQPTPVTLDMVKVPHHGSRQNVTKELVETIDCPLWVFSTDGSTHKHPDAEAIARILHYGTAAHPTLAFNVRSTYSGWWDNEQWRTTLGYNVAYGSITNGLTVQFDDNGLSFSES
jgi:beta-lactamase superfamily II metal-dependent hydrolase